MPRIGILRNTGAYVNSTGFYMVEARVIFRAFDKDEATGTDGIPDFTKPMNFTTKTLQMLYAFGSLKQNIIVDVKTHLDLLGT